MHYVDVKRFEIEKGHGKAFAKGFHDHTIIKGFADLVSMNVGLNLQHADYDLVVITITWLHYDAYLSFKKSDIHQRAHANRKPNPHILRHASMHYEIAHRLDI